MDTYCERCGPGFWAEPLNALSNVSFLIAAFFAWRSATRHQNLSPELRILIALAAVVGVGSFLFHTLATRWAQYLDIIPILLFQLDFIWLYARGQMGLNYTKSGLLLALLLVSALPLLQIQHIMNGSLMYLPAWMLLVGFAAWHIRHSKNEPWHLMIAAVLLFVALTFRTIDQAVCDKLPYGTHFLWHLINGGTFFLVMQSLIVNPPAASKPEMQISKSV
jgi:hypothetical protein